MRKLYGIKTHPDGQSLMVQWTFAPARKDMEWDWLIWIDVTEVTGMFWGTKHEPIKFKNRAAARAWIDRDIQSDRDVQDNLTPGVEYYPRRDTERRGPPHET